MAAVVIEVLEEAGRVATWQDVKDYITSNYEISQDIGRGLKLEFRYAGGRSQMVFVTHFVLENGREDWVIVESPFGEFGKVDLGKALNAVADMVCGGMGLMMGRYVTLRDAVPLENLDVNELERPLHLVMSSADELEAALTGRDEF